MKILVTSGATREPIDSVRMITNRSTGKTGAILTDFLREAGHEAELFCGEGSILPQRVAQVSHYSDFQSLRALLEKRLASGDIEVVIHAAAVSDYSVAFVHNLDGVALSRDRKLSSDSEYLQLQLSRNPKLIELLARFSPTPIQVIAFKLTDTEDSQKIQQSVDSLLNVRGVTHVVQNNLSDILGGAHRFQLFDSNGHVATTSNAAALAQLLHTHVLRKPS